MTNRVKRRRADPADRDPCEPRRYATMKGLRQAVERDRASADGLREAATDLLRVYDLTHLVHDVAYESVNDAVARVRLALRSSESDSGIDVERLRQALINVNGHIGSGNADSIAAEYDNLARLSGPTHVFDSTFHTVRPIDTGPRRDSGIDEDARDEAVRRAMLFVMQMSDVQLHGFAPVALIRALEQDGYTVAPRTETSEP